MKSNFQWKLVVLATVVCLCTSLILLVSCGEPDASTAETTEALPKGFTLVSNDAVRVEGGDNSYTLYVDEENKAIDLKTIVRAPEAYTVTNAEGKLLDNHILLTENDGDTFTVYYGAGKEIYRLTVVFNRYVSVRFEGVPAPIKLPLGKTVGIPEEKPVKEGYTFEKWDFDFTAPIHADTTVAAKWKANTYTVTFDAKEGVLVQANMKVTYGETVNLPIPSKTGFVFTGWHDGSAIVNSGIWTIAKDVTLTAMWDNHDYKITYDPNGGYVDKTLQGVSFGQPFSTPTPTRPGYTFLGWFCEDKAVNTTSYAYRADKTFVAKWQENRYLVTFETNGGDAIEGGEYLYSEMAAILPTREGYTFGGWFFDTDLSKTDADISESNAVTAYAYWREETKAFDLRYTLTAQGAIILGVKKDAASYNLPAYIGGKAVIAIGDRAFENKAELVSLYFPKTVTAIGEYAFSGCTSLQKINALTLENKTVNIVLTDILSIGAYAFSGCTFTEITLPQALTSLSSGVFADCKQLTSVNTEHLVTLGEAAFAGCSSLKSLSAANLTEIGKNAFRGASSLTAITLSDKVKTIGSGAFADCTALTALTLPKDLTAIAPETFRGCLLLKTLNGFLTATKIVSIGEYAFSGCEALATVGVPSSVKTIGAYAFEGCLKLESLTLPSTITVIENGTFKNCSYLKTLTATGALKTVGDEAFSGCRRLTTLSLGSALTAIGVSAFENCIALAEFSFPTTLKTLSAAAFKGCTRLSTASIPTAITVIPEGLFDGCLALTKVTMHDGITEIGARAFASCQALAVETLPSSCSVIGREAFVSCRAISQLTIDKVLSHIASRAFADCISLSKISFSGTTERWKGAVSDDAFVGCEDLKTIETVTWSYDDLRASLTYNHKTGAYFAIDQTLAFSNYRPTAVILFKENDVYYNNLVKIENGKATVNSEYTWLLTVKGTTGFMDFTSTITVSLFDVMDMGSYGYIMLDLGSDIASLQNLKTCAITLEIKGKADLDKLLYTADLGKVTLEDVKNELTPDSDRTDSETVNGITSEGGKALFDGKYDTVYRASAAEAIVMTADKPFTLTSYSFITAKGQSAYPTALPLSFTVYGGILLKDGNIEWVALSHVENSRMTADALTEFNFKIDAQRAYQHYKIVFEEDGPIVLSELVLYGTKA